MKRLNGNRLRLMFAGAVAVMAFGSGSANADFTFGEPIHLEPPISSPNEDGINYITTDGLEMYLACEDRGGYGIWDIFVSRRATVNDDWGELENLGATINTGQSDVHPSLTVDGLEMYFTSFYRPGGYGNSDTWVARRATKNDPWGPPENLGSVVNSSVWDHAPRVSADGLELYFSSTRPGGYGAEDLWVAKRATKNDPWQSPMNLGPLVNSPGSEDFPILSTDGLLLVFSEYPERPVRAGGCGGPDIWLARRANPSDPWGTPVNAGPMVNTPGLDVAMALSPDGLTLYFSSTRPGGLGGKTFGDPYRSPILPIVDYNGDGRVAVEDLAVLIDNWDQSEFLCDMGPMPWGDGIVDRQDLEVLMGYWECDVLDGTLLAHWKLDETEGATACDSTDDHDAAVMGEALWQPDDGQIDGAIQLDGVNDYVVTPLVLDPADGVFSAFAWIKGGVPGQAIVSQADGSDWLLTDARGCLMTALISAGRRPGDPLLSETIVTDGHWHRIGLVWDRSYRSLYVDDELAATDVCLQNNFFSSRGELYIGAASDRRSGTFWSGMIDDVRIYDRVVVPSGQ